MTIPRHGHTDVERLRVARAFDTARATTVGIELGVWAGRGDWAACSQEHRDQAGYRALTGIDALIGRLVSFRAELNAEVAAEYIELRKRPDAPDIGELTGRLLDVARHVPVGGRLPMPQSRWRDTTGEDGEVVVADYRQGHVVVTGDALPGETTIHPSQFGCRYIAITEKNSET